jgi:glycosyltransferase involved in cell wall biosynthesis
MPKISILVPIYNVEPYLRECLDSLINQTLKDIEIICINDGSTDRSLSILEDYASNDPRIHIVNKANSGYGHSMNRALDLATGDYIGIVESDDFVAPTMFDKLYEEAIINNADVVKSNYFEYTSSSDSLNFVENLKGCAYHTVLSPIDAQSVFLTRPSIWSGVYKRSFLLNNKIRFLETPGASYQDTSFAFKVWASAERVYLTRDAFLYYRKDNMDSSVNSASKVFCICDEYEEIEKFLDNRPTLKPRLAQLAFFMKYKAYKWNYNRLATPFQYAFLLRMEDHFKQAEQLGLISSSFFTAREMGEINKIIQYKDRYFHETSKDYNDDRLSLNFTMNLQIYKRGFLLTIDQCKGIIIYGAGAIGNRVAQILIDEKLSNKIKCFAVSKSSDNPDSLLGFPVYPIDELFQYEKEYVVVVAVKEKNQYEIVKKLRMLQFKNIVSMESKLLNMFL